jgi:hypothetical protein
MTRLREHHHRTDLLARELVADLSVYLLRCALTLLLG